MVPLHLSFLLACAPAVVSGDGPLQFDGGSDDGGALDGGAPDGGGDGGSLDGGSDEVPSLSLALDDEVVTMIRASWTPSGDPELGVEYRFEEEAWQLAPVLGAGDAVILGVPAEVEVEARLLAEVDGVELRGPTSRITTGELPDDLPLPFVEVYDEALADPARWAMISVSSGSYTYMPPYWIEIFDRQGRVVWYHEVSDFMFAFYPTVALDGTHVWYDMENIFGLGTATPSINRRTLDGRWSTSVSVPGMGQAAGEGPDGSFFFELRSSSQGYGLSQVDSSGNISRVWDCAAWMSARGRTSRDCYMNTSNWSEAHGTVLTSMFESNTVFEIDLATGQPVRQMGQLTVGEPYDFDPPESMFDYQHHVHWIDEDTLLASTHEVGTSYVQIAAEYHVDDATQTLTRGWYYRSTDRWATQVGEAIRLPGGNTVQGYGQDGAVREVTPDLQTAWEVSWEEDYAGYRVVGHLSLFDDLYALNRGPQ